MPKMFEENEQDIRDSEGLLQGAIDALAGYIAILDERGDVIKTNESWRSPGDHRPSFIGHSCGVGANYIESCLAEGGKTSEPDSFGGALARGITGVISGQNKVFETEYPFDIENAQNWLTVRVTRFGGDASAYFIVKHEDVSARRATEQALRTSEQSYRILAETASDVIIKIDTASTIIFVNHAIERIFGYRPEEVVGKPLTMLMPEYLRESHREGLAHYLQTGNRNLNWDSLEVPAQHQNGHIFPLEISFGEFDQDGKHFFIGVARDISHRKQSEAALSESQMMLALAMRSSRMGAWENDLATGVVNWSEELEEIFGLEKGGFDQTRIAFYALIHEDDRERTRSEIQAAIDERRDYAVEFRFRHADGSVRWMEGRGQAVYSEKGEPVRLYGIGIDITERKRAEEKLRETTAVLRAINENTPTLIYTKNLYGQLTTANPATLRFIGKSAAEAIGKTEAEFLDDKAAARQIMENDRSLIESGQTQIYEETVENSAGTHTFLSIKTPQTDGGKIVGLIGVSTDITDRKKAEEKIRESESTLKAFYNSSPLLMGITELFAGDLDILHVYDNPAACAFFGLKAGETFNRSSTELGAPPEVIARWAKNYRESQQRDQPVSFEYEEPVGDQMRWLSATVSYIGEGADGRARFAYLAEDVTEKKRAQEMLIQAERRASAEYLELLLRIVPLAQTLGAARELISVYRTIREFVYVSMPCTAFFVSSFDATESVRKAAYVWSVEGEIDVSVLPPMLLTADGGPNSQAIFQKKSVVVGRYMEMMQDRPHVILQDNGINPNSALVVPLMVNNEPVGTLEVQAYQKDAFTPEHVIALEMVASLASVAIENVRLLEIEARARFDAETANRAKDEFLSVLSHELRTPLNAILGWARAMKTGLLDEDRNRQAIETIERNARLQNNLIEDLLDVSRIISGKMRIEEEEVDFLGVVSSAIETVRPLAESKEIRLEFVPEAEPHKINGDATRLQQIVVNLVNNAVKFTPAGGSVSLRLSQTDEIVRLEIADTGIGIGADFLPFIFERFRQADSTTQRNHSGLGLGLTIVRHLTELHGGRVEAASEGDGRGATFTVEIPLSKKALPILTAFDPKKVSLPETIDTAVLHNKGVLLVDDDCDGIAPLQMLLEKYGARVMCTDSARAALEHLSETSFDLLISDIGMPEMDGYRLIAEVRGSQLNQNVAAIALTAYAGAEDRERTFAAGYQRHLAKPIDFEQFLQTSVELLADEKNG